MPAQSATAFDVGAECDIQSDVLLIESRSPMGHLSTIGADYLPRLAVTLAGWRREHVGHGGAAASARLVGLVASAPTTRRAVDDIDDAVLAALRWARAATAVACGRRWRRRA